jgi:RHS repeat-associated protein
VVERSVIYDHVGRTRFVTRYAYHHGYFDGVEREFRGFGMVEQFDTEEFAALSRSDDLPAGDNIDAASHVPPVLTRTWFHTGIHLGREHVSDFFAGLLDVNDKGEYYREPGSSDAQAREMLLPDTVLPPGLTAEEEREACRALKGAMLRQEIYALDGTDREPHPYFVSEQTLAVRVLQPRRGRQNAVFVTHVSEALTHHYERNPLDPRVQHTLTLETDAFANVLKQASIGYGRRQPDASLPSDFDRAQQARTLITYTEGRMTNAIGDGPASSRDYRTPLPAEARTFELTGYTPTGAGGRFQPSDLVTPDPGDPTGRRRIAVFDSEIPYEEQPSSGRQRRVIEHSRTRYRRDDLSGLLGVGDLDPLAIHGESYTLALTPGLLAQVFRRNGQPLLSNPQDVLPIDAAAGLAADRGGYVDLDGDGHWWVPSGTVFLSPDAHDPPAAELLDARRHFFLPRRYRDPFHTDAVSTETVVQYDGYDLLVVESRDALGNRVTVGERLANGDIDETKSGNDYRLLQPRLLTDANGNRTEASFDALGLVAGTATMGKPSQAMGDLLDASFQADLTQAQVDAFLIAPREAGPTPGESDASTITHELLGNATTRIVYDLTRFKRLGQPSFSAIVARETHVSDIPTGQRSKLQISVAYSDGFSRSIQSKMQAEPGPVPIRDANGRVVIGANGQPDMTVASVSPRWVGSGWAVFNNKGKPVRQFEPFFTHTHSFEFDVKIGVSPVMFYDPVQRVVAVLHPNHTWEKSLVDAWRQETWDVNDTTLSADPRLDPHVGEYFRRLDTAEYLPTWHTLRTDPAHEIAFAAAYPDAAVRARETEAAIKTELHAGTPGIAHADSLGRSFLAIGHNRFERSGTVVDEHYAARSTIDVEGNQREVTDAKDRIVVRYDFDMLGVRLHQASMEAGERWRLSDVAGQPLYSWDSRDHRIRASYDRLRRAVQARLLAGAGPELLIALTVYGEAEPDATTNNVCGRAVRLFDQAGLVVSDAYDFKGNRLRGRRQFTREYKEIIDWSADPALDPQQDFASSMEYDALNRVRAATSPDGSTSRPVYNEAGLLESIAVALQGGASDVSFIDNIDYDAKGRRVAIDRSNGVRTAYEYDPITSRHTRLVTTRPVGLNGLAAQLFSNAAVLQDINYTFDPVGNVVHLIDDALPTLFFANQQVEPAARYTYDAAYRLIEARGRESIRQNALRPRPPQSSYRDYPYAGLGASSFDPIAVRNYTQQYHYDEVGNIQRLIHAAASDAWARDYAYEELSLIEAGKVNNRLSGTVLGANGNQPLTEAYGHDEHGNLIAMPHLASLQWDFMDRLHVCARQIVNAGTPESTYYVYDASGQRVRKVTERQNGSRKCDRSYLGGFEIYREYDAAGTEVLLERETLHVMDDKQRVALIDTRTLGTDESPRQLIRYQLGNHLDSASLELDADGHVISYEEYHPYGTTSYQAGRSAAEISLKRYRYTGMERDEESGFAYHTARYYLPWLGRWANCDPAGVSDGANLFVVARNNPVIRTDPNGTDSHKAAGLSLDKAYTIRKFDEEGKETEREMHFVVPQNIRSVEAYKKWAAEQNIQIVGEVTMTFDRGERIFESQWFVLPNEPKKEDKGGGLFSSLLSAAEFGVSFFFSSKVRWSIRAFQFGKRWWDSGSALDALKDTAVDIAEDYVVDKTFGKLFGKGDSAGINSKGGKPGRRGSGGGARKNGGAGGGGGGDPGSGSSGKPSNGTRPRSSNQTRLNSARHQARKDAVDEVVETARAGVGSERSLHTIRVLEEDYGTEAVAYLAKHGKLPRNVTDLEFSHLFPASKYPEFAHKFEYGVLTGKREHRSGHHGGDTRRDLNGAPLDPDFDDRWGFQIFKFNDD